MSRIILTPNPDEIGVFVRNSNGIEGIPAGPNDKVHHQQYVTACNMAVEAAENCAPYSCQDIHTAIMQNQAPQEEIGVWRKVQVYYGSQAMPAPQHVASLMQCWHEQVEDAFQQTVTDNKTLRILFYEGLCIHPFIDGNGRTFRLLLNYWRLRAGHKWYMFPEEEWDAIWLPALREYEREIFIPRHRSVYQKD